MESGLRLALLPIWEPSPTCTSTISIWLTSIPSLVKIRKVRFKNIRGSSFTVVAAKLARSGKVLCKDMVVGDINLTYKGPEAPATSSWCSNVVPAPAFSSTQPPSLCQSLLIKLCTYSIDN
ncbi:hypothetical protein CRG98_011633 [Punica granatum]|uniref:Uncharacterized protein n=1 Tax=Punica granatum TaxID=22663 RepID=A0A2I0KHN1_PUNGR|nr:hypothetical protein CRG98_011633 [Punica granatum]